MNCGQQCAGRCGLGFSYCVFYGQPQGGNAWEVRFEFVVSLCVHHHA